MSRIKRIYAVESLGVRVVVCSTSKDRAIDVAIPVLHNYAALRNVRDIHTEWKRDRTWLANQHAAGEILSVFDSRIR